MFVDQTMATLVELSRRCFVESAVGVGAVANSDQ
jgi:hypothetical protein